MVPTCLDGIVAGTLAATMTVCWVQLQAAGGLSQAIVSPEQRAVTFLSAEVPRWPVENNCYSCHNNGDAARALFTAMRVNLSVAESAIADTAIWLGRPDAWDDNALGLEFSDHSLARIQFASALVAAMDAGVIDTVTPLVKAASLVAADQKDDGSWRLDTSMSIGSPATYGTALASVSALMTLQRVGDERFTEAIARGGQWLRELDVKTVLDAAAVVLGLGHADDALAIRQRQASLTLIVDGQAPSGGWGAYLTTPTEPFDTAVVLLALVPLVDTDELADPAIAPVELRRFIAEGRLFLLNEQLDDGSWIETTRPPGQQSYAQWISTTGWATLALLATKDIVKM